MPLEVVESVQLLVAGPAEVVRSTLDRYIAAGARHLVCRVAALDMDVQMRQLERLAALYPA
jgi:hypothetical protein